ncbi:MAG: lyase-like protein [Candidatus Eremiobacteraeota bacterium]|nr:lyase-like protein [Candidatus Eremiobacteraeota bacterium]
MFDRCGVFAVVACSALSACGGGGGGGAVPVGAPTATPVASASPTPAPTSAAVAFSFAIPTGTSARLKRPLYVSNATQSATITVSSAKSAPVQTSVDCTSVCAGTLNVPLGSDTFNVVLRDAKAGGGNVLSAGTAVQTVVPGANTLDVTLGGVVASVTAVASPASLPAGTSAASTIVVVAKDAAGRTITGSEPFVDASAKPAPLTVSESDNAATGDGRLVPSTSVFASPSDALTVAYNGLATYGGTLTVGTASTTISVLPTIVEYSVPTQAAYPEELAVGPDGNVWFSEGNATQVGQVGTVTSSGVVHEFPVHGRPSGIAAGPDGNLWITTNYNHVVVMTTSGTALHEFVVGDPNILTAIVAGPDGAMWFSEDNGIDRIAMDGTITRYPFGSVGVPAGPASTLTLGPDGNFWEPVSSNRSIARLTPAGALTEFPTSMALACPAALTAGPDGALWFTEGAMDKIGRITIDGTITEFPAVPPSGTCGTPFVGAEPFGIAAGNDGNLWFTESGSGKVARMSTTGAITEFPVPSGALSGPTFIIRSADKNLWFSEAAANKIAKLVY